MGLATFVPFLALVLGATAVPALQDDNPALDCYGRQMAAHLTSWNTECGVGSGHSLGSEIAMPAWDKLCRPLPADTHGLEVHMLADGCHVQAFRGSVCDDYPNNRLFKMGPGCLWSGGDIYRSFMVTCDNKTLEELLGD